MSDKQPWLEINDEEITAEQLTATVAARAQQRQAELGEVKLTFPAFGFVG
jgi:hypothetical protein